MTTAVPDVSDSLSGTALRQAMSRVMLAWVFGAVWMNALAGAPLTVFATRLGATNFEFGLLAALPFLAMVLSLPASVLTDRSGYRNRVFFAGLYPNRVLWIAVAVLPPWLLRHYGGAGSVRGPGLAVFAFLSLLFVINVGQAVGAPAWNSWMADIVPPRLRGRYFSRRRQAGIVTAVPATLLAGWVLDRYSHADGDTLLTVCGWIFAVAAVFGTADIVCHQFVPHARRPRPREPIARMLARPLRDRRFVWFSLGAAVLWFAVAGQAQFVNKFLIERLKLQGTQVQLMVLVGPLVAQWLVLPVWGRTIDRYGKKPAMLLATAGLVPVGAGWVLMGEGHVWLGYVLSVAGSALWTGVDVSNFNLVLELSGTDAGRPGGTAYAAVNGVIVNIAGCLGGLFYGTVAQWTQGRTWHVGGLPPLTYYEVLFLVSAGLRLVAIVPMLRVTEPDAQPTVDALRFIAGSLYNNAVGVVTLPTRLLARRDEQE